MNSPRDPAQSEFAFAVRLLVKVLGEALVAVIVNRDVEAVRTWEAGEGHIIVEERRRIQEAAEIIEILSAVESLSTVRAWFMGGANPQLDGAGPAEALADGRARDVMGAARTYADG